MENLKCYEPDEPPVSVGEIFENDCSDKSGVHFEENSTLSSCCNCLIYTCTANGEITDTSGNKHNFFFWNTTVSKKCCMHCDGTVYKADTVIDTTEAQNDSAICHTVETSVCKIIEDPRKGPKIAEIVVDVTYKDCCPFGDQVYGLNSTRNDPASCAVLTCLDPKLLPEANWVSEQVFDSCDCCLTTNCKNVKNGTMVEKGFKCVGFNKECNKEVEYECCDGKFVISNENPKSVTVTADEVTNTVTTEEVATIAPDSDKQTRCSREKGSYFGRTNKCYILVNTKRDSWNSSRSFCQNQYSGGDLASITDKETNDFIKTNIKILFPTWLGGVRVNDKWTWIDGATWTEFENSNMKENNRGEDYLYMDAAYGWRDANARANLDYLCQY